MIKFDPAEEFHDSQTVLKFHFFDCGSFTLWAVAKKWAKKYGRSEWEYFDTPRYWDYVDDYCFFVKKYSNVIDRYSNVDVIPNPELTWRNQEYIEKYHGLKPVPVVHYTTSMDWLEKYINRGHDLIALGGLVGSIKTEGARIWLDRAFDVICNQPSRLPRVMTHGFGITSWNVLKRYPWWSVDNSTWTQIGAFGLIIVPHKRGGKFIFDEKPYKVNVSEDSPTKKEYGKHFHSYSSAEQHIILDWLDRIGIPLGQNSDEGECLDIGVVNNHSCRKAANILFYEAFRKSLPDYPWPFRSHQRRGFGMQCQERPIVRGHQGAQSLSAPKCGNRKAES